MSFLDVELHYGDIKLRPLERRDEREWLELRSRNRAWLQRWESQVPPGPPLKPVSFPASIRHHRKAMLDRREMPLAIEFQGALVGRMSLSDIEWGAHSTGHVGYWIDEGHAGKGIVTSSLGMLIQWAFREGLHRVEVAVCPENESSVRVAKKLHLREEGLRERAIYINGVWRDHRIFAITAEEPRIGSLWP